MDATASSEQGRFVMIHFFIVSFRECMRSRKRLRAGFLTLIGWALFSAIGSASAQPILIEEIGNNYGYGYFQPVLANYGIARGSIFSIAGTDLAQSTASQDPPLQQSLAGVTIDVNVGGVAAQAIPYFVSPGQIIAILPSITPVGTGTITVTSGGQTGSAPIRVVESAFGLMATVGGAVGNAVAQNDSEGGEQPSATNAANPGDSVTLFGSGLGPAPGDETELQTPTDLTSIPVEVDIGGVSATVTWRGRTVYPGLDEIEVIVPAGISGCNVSVVVTAGGADGMPSNFATIPVAASGRLCSDDPVLAPVTLEERQGLASLASVNIGSIALTNVTPVLQYPGPPSPPGQVRPPIHSARMVVGADSAYVTFQKYTAQEFASSGFLQEASMGSCLILGGVPLTGWTYFTSLSAGPQVDINGPYGTLALAASYPYGWVYVEQSGTSPRIIPPAGGTFTFENGSGGPGVGPFTASLTEDFMPPLKWTNWRDIRTVQRDRGQLITWTGGAEGSYVEISGYSYVWEASPLANGSDYYVYFTCSAPVSAGQFMVPAAVLKSLPPSTSGGLYPSPNGNLWVANKTIQRFSAPGLDLGSVTIGIGSGISVPFN